MGNREREKEFGTQPVRGAGKQKSGARLHPEVKSFFLGPDPSSPESIPHPPPPFFSFLPPHLQDALQPSRSGVLNKEGIEKCLQGIQGLTVKYL